LDIIAYIPLTIVVDKMKYSFLFPYYARKSSPWATPKLKNLETL